MIYIIIYIQKIIIKIKLEKLFRKMSFILNYFEKVILRLLKIKKDKIWEINVFLII